MEEKYELRKVDEDSFEDAEAPAHREPGSRRAHQVAAPVEVIDVFASPENIARFGSPGDVVDGMRVRYIFFPTWRSELLNLTLFFVTSILAVWGSRAYPWLVIPGKLFRIGDEQLYLLLPLLIFVPGYFLARVFLTVFDAKYMLDHIGVEAHIGLVSLQLRQPRLRYEDIRGVEPIQGLFERILGIGSLLVGSAMSQDVELVMKGVPHPRDIQLLINSERDRVNNKFSGDGASRAKFDAVASD